jgi:hypothetical protein
MSAPTTIPLLPCTAPDPTAEFYEALGFVAAHRQTRPYLYMALARAEVNLHFKDAAPGLNPDDELSGGCLVMVDDVTVYHRDLARGLQAHYGRVPVRGLPRLTRLRPGGTRFCVFDPSGNCIVFVERDEPAVEYGGSRALSGLAKAHDNVRIFRDFKNDDALALRALDTALLKYRESAPRIDVARALADRIELAIVLADSDTAEATEAELQSMSLSVDERELIGAELGAIDELKRWLA